MKIGRIGEFLLVPRLKLEAYDYSCYTLISFAFALVTATWWQFHGNEALSSQNLFVINLLKVVSNLYKIFFIFQRTLLLFLLTARVEREVVVDGDCNKLFTWCFFYLIGKPVASFTSNKMDASHIESYVVFIVMSSYSTLWEKINAIRNNSHKWNRWNKIRIVFKKNATEQNIVCNIFHGSIMLYTGVPHKAMSWLRYRSSSRDELAGRALKSNLQHTFTWILVKQGSYTCIEDGRIFPWGFWGRPTERVNAITRSLVMIMVTCCKRERVKSPSLWASHQEGCPLLVATHEVTLWKADRGSRRTTYQRLYTR